MVGQIYPLEFHLIKFIPLIPKPRFRHLSITYDIVSIKIYDKRDDSEFETVNFPSLDGDFLALRPMESISINSSELLEHLAKLLTRNKLLTQKLLKQGYGYHKLRKTFSKFYR